MSEAEIRRRQDYKRNRKNWILIQAAALAVVIIIALGSFLVYDRMNRTYYIEYTENGSADYRVNYKPNSFFEEEWIGSGQSYVSSLVNGIQADFNYALNMDTVNVGFDYTYGVTAQLIVSDKTTGDPIFNPTDVLVADKTAEARRTDKIIVKETVNVDFSKYNYLAHQFIQAYSLTNATSMLVVTMHVDVLSQSDEFENNNENSYSVSLNIPLGEENFSMFTTSSAPAGESKVLACKGAVSRNIFLTIGIVGSVIAFVLGCVLVLFVYVTRNEDVNYQIKVQKLVSSYRSFIQQIEGEFDTEGYQIVAIKTFTEMLGIRDTIQAPILMSENKDETMTQFLIPTNTKILYVYDIKVENYDEIYGVYEEEEPRGRVLEFEDEEGVEEAIIIEEDVDMEDLAEAMATPDVILDEVDFVSDDDVEYEGTEEAPGVEVVGVVWPERRKKNKVYRYDPNGEKLSEGDMVLVPTRDAARDREVIRKAAIARANHTIDPETHPHALKKIIGVIKRRAEAALTPKEEKDETSDT
ncbi:MAG: hypothetical protein IJX58_07595 [Clostridia bacterium]|nr:hypothetical protein [Clostridia bacterium]